MPPVGIDTIDEIRALFGRHSVPQVYVKWLAPKQDNEKNQIYLGSGLDGATNIFPATIVPRSPSESTFKRNSSEGDPIVEARLDFAWMNREGVLHDAPEARIIDYFQYPEIRFSGFLRGCAEPPDALRRSKQANYGTRVLMLGASAAGKTIGLVLTEVEDEVVSRMPDLPESPTLPSLRVLSIEGGAGILPVDLLIKDLAAVHRSGWHPSVILKPSERAPIPFSGNQGGGYTLEALLGIPANANKEPDKHGYEIKSYAKGKISLITPTADAGFEGAHTFREFMEAYGRPGQAGDGRLVFTGIHRCGTKNVATGCILTIQGYDAQQDRFASDANEISVAIKHDESNDVISAWTFNKLANIWNRKHASAVYVQRECRPYTGSARHDGEYRFLADVFICEGTDIWRLLRAIHSGLVYFDPAHAIYADNKAKVRHQWRINTTKLEAALRRLYRDVRRVTLN